MNAAWFIVGYIVGSVIAIGAIYFGYRIAERNVKGGAR